MTTDSSPMERDELLAHYLGCRALVLRAAVSGRLEMRLLTGINTGKSKVWNLVVLAASDRSFSRPRWPTDASDLVAVLRAESVDAGRADGSASHSADLEPFYASVPLGTPGGFDLAPALATWLLACGWRLASTGIVRCQPQQTALVRRGAALHGAEVGSSERLLHAAVDELWEHNTPSLPLIDRRRHGHEVGQRFTRGDNAGEAGPRPCCEVCGTPDFVPSLWGLCADCVADGGVRSIPERQLLVHGNKVRFVVPGEYPPRREPQPRAPDDITDPWELAEHLGDPMPEDVWQWEGALTKFHDDEHGIVLDEAGHLFGPIEVVAEREFAKPGCGELVANQRWLRTG